MKALDRNGQVLDAEFDVEPNKDGAFIVFHARYGTRGSGREVNIDYLRALEIVLARLVTLGAVITAIDVDSRVALTLPPAERRLPLSYPIHLQQIADVGRLRRDITEAQRRVAQKTTAKPAGGNNHKRIRIAMTFPPETNLDAVRSTITSQAALETPSIVDTHVAQAVQMSFPPYRSAMPITSIAPATVVSVVDAEVLERAFAGHARVQNALADFVRARGLVPISPASNGPDFDLGWQGLQFTVAEIKSLNGANVERQLRLGLGQVIQYRTMLSRSGIVAQAVLAVEHPVDPLWIDVCSSAGVILTWPSEWPRLAESIALAIV